MKNVYVNESKVKIYTRIAQFCMFGGLLVLAGGMYISFTQTERIGLSMGALVIGFALSQIGIFFMNRWGRRPRPYELITNALKGMDNRYRLFHHFKPTPHLLVGPSGLWIILPQYQGGKISYSGGRWRQNWGGIGALYMRIFAQESLGRPDMEANAEKANLVSFLKSLFPEEENFPINTVLVFTNPRADLDPVEDEQSPAYAIKVDKLKDLIRKKGKSKSLSQDKVEIIRRAILGEEVDQAVLDTSNETDQIES